MYDTLFLILTMLETLISQLSKIFSLISINYFPETLPEETDDKKLKSMVL